MNAAAVPPKRDDSEPGASMRRRLAGFVATLRGAGFAIGHAETTDAARVIASPAAERPDGLCAALRALFCSRQTELARFDVFLTPTLTQPPRPVGYWDLNEPDYEKYISTWTDAAFLFPFNLSGLPAVSVPATWTKDDIPIGVQLVGRYGDEATILRLSAQLEQARPWIQRRPSICAGG